MDLDAMMDNVKYAKAMGIDEPDPQQEFAKFTPEELAAFKQEALQKGWLDFEAMCRYPLGLWLFSRYLVDSKANVAAGAFCVAVAEYKAMINPENIAAKKAEILSTYYENAPAEPADISYEDENTLRIPVDSAKAKVTDLYGKHIKAPVQRRASSMARASKVAAGPWPLMEGKATLGADGMDMFDVTEALMFKFLEQAAKPGFMTSPRFDVYLRFLKIQQAPPKEELFNQFRILGKGGFGLVFACRTYTTGRMYAMKTCDKKRVKKGNCKALCDNEHWALKLLDSPFTVNLKYAFQSNKKLVLIIDLMMGGDLNFWLIKDKTFSEERAKYYMARTALGLQCLHVQDIVYRDLKPENILVDEEGRTRLSDLGLACKITPTLKGMSGTPGYLAPEMLQKEIYNHSVDWFSFGCMLYEFLQGKSPFRSEAANTWGGGKEMTKNIMAAAMEMEVTNYEGFPEQAKDLCQKLLVKDPTKRIGYNGAEEVMAHPWFSSLDWGMMKADKTEPPFAPGKGLNMKDADEIGEFASLGDEIKLEPGDFPLAEWDFVSPKAYQAEVVWLLKFQEGKDVKPIKSGGGGCAIL